MTSIQNSTWLTIGGEQTTIIQYEDTNEQKQEFNFKIGSKNVSERFFKQFPPTLDETEHAILLIEYSIMPSAKSILKSNILYTEDTDMLEIERLIQNDDSSHSGVITRKEIEILFSRLSAIISGRPISSDNLPEDSEFATKLIILREVLHHLGFTEIHFVKPTK